MGLFDLLKNTVEGVAETAINVVKLPIGGVTAPLDNGQSIVDAANGVVEGVKKIGDAEKRDDDR